MAPVLGERWNWEGEEGGEKRFPSSPAFSLAPQNNIQESRLSALLVSPQMSDGSEQAP